jgi:hypothetical protein
VREQTTSLRLEVGADENLDAEELVAITDELQEELLDANVNDVRTLASGEPPTGAKAGEVLEFGTLIVTLSPIILESVVGIVRSWVSRRGSRSIKMKIGEDTLEMSGLTSQEQSRLIEEWLERNSDR